MQQFGERLGQAVGDGLGRDGLIIVVIGLELAHQFVAADAGGDGEGAEIILAAAIASGAMKSARA